MWGLPTILIDGGLASPRLITIVMDGHIVVKDSGLDGTLAFACVFCVYWVYGIEYPRKLKNTMLFSENYLFKVAQDKPPITVQKVFTMLST